MKRFLPVLVSLVLVLSLIAVPAYAVESYTFTLASPEDGIFTCPVSVPDGLYDVFVDFHHSGCFTFDAVYISFGDPSSSSFVPSPVSFLDGSIQAHFVVDGDLFCLILLDPSGSPIYFSSSDVPFCQVVLTPVSDSSSPTLSGVLDPGMMSGVLDQVVSILPVVLVVIIGFIAIRKGISFLRGFLAGS